MDDKQKTIKAVKGTNNFFNLFGEPDIYVKTVLEVFLEELMEIKNEKSVHLSGEAGQEGVETPNSSSQRQEDTPN